MRDKLWINRWTERRKESAVSNAKQGISFLGGYNMTDYKNVLFELWVGLNMYKGSPTSYYSNIIPPNCSEVIKVRLSDHRSSENEWAQNELTGYPNRRYSIVIFSMKSMPDESKQDIVETEWQSYLSNGIPVYEKCFNRFYLKDTFPKLISILQDIYNGGAPEDNTIRVDLTENKQYKTRYNMKKTIRLSESELHRVIKESIKKMLSEGEAWANQPPIDEFHPDWWYYRQEIEPEGLEDFDPCMDLSDEEYDEHLRQEFGESKLRKVIRESVKRILREHTWGETPELEDDEIPQEQIVKQGKNYVLKKGWYLGEDPYDTRGVTDYRCDIFLTQPQIDAFNNYVSQQQKSYINAGGHQYPEDHVYYGSYEDTRLGMTKIYYGKLLDPHDDMWGRRIILKNFTDASGMPDEHNVRYYISKPE